MARYKPSVSGLISTLPHYKSLIFCPASWRNFLGLYCKKYSSSTSLSTVVLASALENVFQLEAASENTEPDMNEHPTMDYYEISDHDSEPDLDWALETSNYIVSLCKIEDSVSPLVSFPIPFPPMCEVHCDVDNDIHVLAWTCVWGLSVMNIKDKCMGTPEIFSHQARNLLAVLLSWLKNQASGLPLFPQYRLLFLRTLDELIQLSTLSSCASILNFICDHIIHVKSVVFSSTVSEILEERRILSNMSTALLKRAEPLLSSELVSTILLLNAQLLDANASAFNPRGVRNDDCLPKCETDFTPGATPESQHLDQVYTKLWTLLGNMHDPRIMLRDALPPATSELKVRKSISDMLTGINDLVLEFARVANEAKEHLRNPAKERLIDPVTREFFCPKYLTSRELFDAQITDAFFRRQVLVHFILKCECLLFYCAERVQLYESAIARCGDKGRRNKFILPECVKNGTKDQVKAWVTAEEEKEIKKVRARIVIVLSRIPPNGSDFVEAIIQLVRDESSWMWWKARFLQPLFDVPPMEMPELEEYAPPPSNPPRSSIGIPRLDNMWLKHAENVDDTFDEPDLNEWMKDLDSEISGEVDPEYQKSRKEQWKWQTYRHYVRRHFSTMTAPTSEHPLRDIKRRANHEPDLTDAEIKELHDREQALEEELKLALQEQEQARLQEEADNRARELKKEQEQEQQRLLAIEQKRQKELDAQRVADEERQRLAARESVIQSTLEAKRLESLDLKSSRMPKRQTPDSLSVKSAGDSHDRYESPSLTSSQARSSRNVPRNVKNEGTPRSSLNKGNTRVGTSNDQQIRSTRSAVDPSDLSIASSQSRRDGGERSAGGSRTVTSPLSNRIDYPPHSSSNLDQRLGNPIQSSSQGSARSRDVRSIVPRNSALPIDTRSVSSYRSDNNRSPVRETGEFSKQMRGRGSTRAPSSSSLTDVGGSNLFKQMAESGTSDINASSMYQDDWRGSATREYEDSNRSSSSSARKRNRDRDYEQQQSSSSADRSKRSRG